MNPKTQTDRTPILELPRLPRPMRRPKATEAEAKAMEKEAVRVASEMRTGWLGLGSLIGKMMDSQAHEALGYHSTQAWMKARLGESASSAFSALRSGRALEGVP